MSNPDFHLDQNIRIDNQRCAGIVLNGESVLFMYRKKNDREFYVIPGGHMQENEDPIETLKREVMEEASITVKNVKLAFEFKDYLKENFDYYYLCEYQDGTLQLGGEESQKNSPENVYEIKWVKFSDISELNILPKAAKEWIQETLVEKKLKF
ncbi:MAG: NUDIX domain-containing protein [Candidatus Dojkabacteria bacterium]